jgi:steroid delta-isomerase-like uncharacterized protein
MPDPAGARILALFKPAHAPRKAQPMSASDNLALVRRFVDEAQSRHNLAAVDEFLAPDFVDYSVPPGLPPGRDGVRMQFAMFFNAMPDLEAVIHEQVADDEKVVTRKTLRGTHLGDLMGFAPTGRALALEVIDILTIKDGKIASHRNLVDQLGLMRQLGAL